MQLLKGHPKGLFILFFSEMWERFSYYGMRSLLVLYMTKQLLYGDSRAYSIYGAYTALVYAAPVLGGLLADRFLGYRLAIIMGGILMALGHFLMAVPTEFCFYVALALICSGNGFFKPNISSLVGKLYPEGGQRRDAGFTIFYMGINIGAFLSPLLCGMVGELIGWHYGFGLAGIGMLCGLTIFWKGEKHLEGHGVPPNPEMLKQPIFSGFNRTHLLYVGCALFIPIVALGLRYNSAIGSLLYIFTALTVGYLLYVAYTSDKVARDRLLVVIVLMFFHMMFWSFFEQAGSSLTLFADRNVNRTFFGWVMPASVTQSYNPLFIILFAPLFAQLWVTMQKRWRQPSIPTKFSLGIVQVGLGFLILVFGALFAKETGITAHTWLVLAYLLHTTGELCISPVGLSAVTKLAPAKAVGTVMGAWFLSISFAQHLAGIIAKFTEVKSESELAAPVSAVESLPIYSDVFLNIGLVAIIVTLLLLVVKPKLKTWTHGVE